MEEASHHKKKTKKAKKNSIKPICTIPFCFFCTMKEPDPFLRASKIKEFFKQIPQRDDQESVLTLSSLWSIAMAKPDNREFPSLGIFESMAKLISRGINDKEWLYRDQNIYIPYYAAHIIGSYSMNKAEFAEIALKSGVIPPLIEILRGKISWVEQRVAIRALAHLVSHENTFEILVEENGEEIVELAMEISSTCLEKIHNQFFKERLKYHCNLLTRGNGGYEIENKKAEEWAIQTQRWSLYLLNYFVHKERFLNLICRNKFLISLSDIWGGIELLKTLCKTRIGRQRVADLEKVLKSLCHLARSSNQWQIMAIESLLNLLKDPETRFKVFETAILSLVDLVEFEETCNGQKSNFGDTITRTLLQDYHKIKYGNNINLQSKKAKKALEEIWELKVEKKRREKMMTEKEVKKRQLLVGILKKQGNQNFRTGEIKRAAMKYTEALNLCIPKMGKERIVLYSNRAQCFLLERKAEAAISDTTRALCLSKAGTGDLHRKSLWRRSQAYDMKGLAKESLIDCLEFVNCCKGKKIPYYAARMIDKQMNATWIFDSVKSRA